MLTEFRMPYSKKKSGLSHRSSWETVTDSRVRLIYSNAMAILLKFNLKDLIALLSGWENDIKQADEQIFTNDHFLIFSSLVDLPCGERIIITY